MKIITCISLTYALFVIMSFKSDFVDSQNSTTNGTIDGSTGLNATLFASMKF